MPRANLDFLPGQVWHITHRRHQRAFPRLRIDQVGPREDDYGNS
jgi:hypothetical protein